MAGCGRGAAPAWTPAQPYGSRTGATLDARQFSVPNIAGTYTGTIQDKLYGAGTLTIVFTQSGSTISGTVTPTWKGHSRTLSASGRVFVKSGKTKVKFGFGAAHFCSGTSTGTVSATHHLNGSYVVPPCKYSAGSSGTYKTVKS